MTRTHAARELVAAIAAQDWTRLEACFAPGAEFRAVVPSSARPFREGSGAEATAQLARWFGDADPLELLDSSVVELPESVHVSYRFAAFRADGWHLLEQQAYAQVEDELIAKLDLLCSGCQRVDYAPPASTTSSVSTG